ncbi:MAG: hypothetical protein K9N35_10465 [Candidatus Marinimicrobia bacterium]|nr:hypothetical protein [Candidatus Neomarinimicrobiota bacterium]
MKRNIQYKILLILNMCLVLIPIGFAQEIEFSQVLSVKADFNFPTDICGNENGDAFVLDALNDRVVKIAASGRSSEIKPQRDTFYKAVGIAWIDSELWIADTPRSRLINLALNGRIKQIIELGHDIEPVDLTGINGNLVVTDRKKHSITVLDKQGTEKYHWGKRGDKVGEFINPGFITTGPENNMIVSDILNRRVMSYSPSGRFPQMIVKSGVESGQILRPKGVALDSEKRVWVVDGYTGSLQAFSVSGKFQALAYSQGKVIRLLTPMGIWIDKKDRIWIVESNANTVSLWQKK